MWARVSLRSRIYLLIVSLVIITVIGGLVMVWYTYRMQGLLNNVAYKYLEAFQASEQLETALANQKGFVSYYFLDGNPDWLKKLGEHRQIFKDRLNTARTLVEAKEQKEALDLIEWEYTLYIASKDRVIAFYKEGDLESGARLHTEVRNHFARILELCDAYKKHFQDRIEEVRRETASDGRKLRIISASAIFLVITLAVLLLFVLIHQILGPLRRLTYETYGQGPRRDSEDEVTALSRSVRDLMEDVDYTHSELERSRETLMQSEKMAMVGKLAAGMAHSIRNPLTSVKMRLFSLNRSLELTPTQQEDFEVISEEIRHTDTIVANFLEFSRPPKLKMQSVSPSDVVNMAIQLLKHRLESYDVEIVLRRDKRLPEIQIDPEQLKEVLVNIVVNACEAMGRGGTIIVEEEEEVLGDSHRRVVIRLTDNGPGIASASLDKVLQPFFTTKEEGTGLGLSIAARIVEEHGGKITFTSEQGSGTTFIITLPVKEPRIEYSPNH